MSRAGHCSTNPDGISADGANEVPVEIRDALGSHGGKYYEMVMTNSPFGKQSSVTL